MLKKISIVAVLAVIIIGTLSFLPTAYAVTGEEVLGSDQATELVEIKESFVIAISCHSFLFQSCDVFNLSLHIVQHL